MAAEILCSRRTRKIVDENGNQILMRKENKKKEPKENGVLTPNVG